MKAQFVQDLRPYNRASIVSGDMVIRAMVKHFIDHQELHYLCVVDEQGNLLGHISRKRVFRAIFSHQVSTDSMVTTLFTLLTSEQASDLLVKHVFTCKETDMLGDVINLMIKYRLDAIPVLDITGKLEGILNIGRLFEEWLKE